MSLKENIIITYLLFPSNKFFFLNILSQCLNSKLIFIKLQLYIQMVLLCCHKQTIIHSCIPLLVLIRYLYRCQNNSGSFTLHLGRVPHKHTTYRQSLDRAETLVLRTLRRQHGRGRTKTKIATHSSFPLRPQLRSNTAPV